MYFNKEKSTKDKIIDILTYNWPLSIRKVYFLLKKEGFNSGYQAVFKAIKEMLNEKILVKQEEGYQLDMSWIKDIHNQTEIIRVNYYSKERSVLFGNENKQAIRVFIFKNWFDFEKYIYYLQKSELAKSKEKQTILAYHSHEWRPLFYMRAEYNWVKNLVKHGHNVYTLCSGDSIVDKWAANFYNSIQAKVKIGQKVAEPAELIVFNDLVIQAYIPDELKEALDKEFKKAKKVEDLDLNYLIKNVFERETSIKVVINQDADLARQISQQILKKFLIDNKDG